MHSRDLVTLGTVCLVVCFVTLWSSAQREPTCKNWPQWRGADSSGVCAASDLPTKLTGAQDILWKTPIPGRGHSSPIVWEKRIFLTTAIEGERIPDFRRSEPQGPDVLGSDRLHTLKVYCLDADSGNLLWERTAYEGAMFGDRHLAGSYASPTPATDGKMVYAYFGSEGLYAYDFGGNLKWKAELGKIPTEGMSVGTSPIIHENLVIVQADRGDGTASNIVAFDKSTGKEVWKTSRKGIQSSFSTPFVLRSAQRTELIAAGNEFIAAYDPRTGRELWRSKGLDGDAITSPVAGHGFLFLTTGNPRKAVYALRLSASGSNQGPPQMAWQFNKGAAQVSSPVLYLDFLYVPSDSGLLSCFDARAGTVIYEGRRPPKGARFTASLVAFGGKLLQVSEEGDVYLVQAGPRHKILGSLELGEPVYASPAIAGCRIYIRGERNLYAIRAGGAVAKPEK